MIQRMRKYRLYPTVEQKQGLRAFMGTCRWTYKQAVAHFRKTNVSSAITLRDLNVTQNQRRQRVYPDGMEPPPDWVFDTPKSIRYNTLRKFQTNVKAAFSNKKNGNIDRFQIRTKSRKKDGHNFTFCEDPTNANITHVADESKALLSISNLKDMPIRCDPGLVVTNEIQITNTNGFWYSVIPLFVQPMPYTNAGKAIALDQGLKASLHYQTCAYLTKHYDTIVLPIFSSKDMVKKSSKRNHAYNKMLLGLKHFQFRELLKTKCEVAGKALVVCSEIQTCGRCSRLHLKIGNQDVFECPHCGHAAGRDVSAALNILRFTCAGSLAVYAIHSLKKKRLTISLGLQRVPD
ncbi:hypothetical protein BBJ28_00006013 [Nothophytophthora sp. Chile5]|nr:hypothetical protein BBJ28_00006013 [Nothophytophthora sp. Chile5]